MDSEKVKHNAKIATEATAFVLGDLIRLALKIVMTGLLIILVTGLLFSCIFAYYVKTSLTTDMDVDLSDFSLNLTSTIWYTDSNGQDQELTTLFSSENRVWVEFKNIPEYMQEATVAIEDKRFTKHKGVDWYRTVAAFGNMFVTMKNDFGGSTITQQLIKNLTEEDDITVQRKLLEIFRALEFEQKYTKDEIMEWYLNTIFLGERCYGVGTAAQTYFGKEVWELSLAECASIVGITNNPSKYDPYISVKNNKERQELILSEMYEQDMISYVEYVDAVSEKLVFQRSETETYHDEIYSYYVDTVIRDVLKDLQEKKGLSAQIAAQLVYNGGYQIYSCIDMDIQNVVDSVYEDTSQLPASWYASSQQLQSAMVIMDPYTGDIVALTGGVGEKTASLVQNRATQSLRPAGSSIKPIAVYGPAFEYGLITQTTLVNDAGPDEIKLTGTSWYPRNANGGYRGIITIRQALTSSINTVSAQILDKLTPQVSYDFLTQKLGVTSLIENDNGMSDIAYAPLALGQLSYGISVRELTQAYTAFINDGIFTYSRTYSHVTDSDGNIVLENTPETIVAFKPNTAYNITNMLQAAVGYGTGTEAYLGFMPVAGKTGTTSDNNDRWFVGFTPYYLAAVWTGYDTPEAMYFSGNPAAQIWKKIMGPIHENLESVDFPYPTIGAPTNIFGDLEEELEKQEEEEASPSPSPSTTPTPTPTPSNTPTNTPTPTPTPTPSPIPTPTIPVTDPGTTPTPSAPV